MLAPVKCRILSPPNIDMASRGRGGLAFPARSADTKRPRFPLEEEYRISRSVRMI